MQCPDCEARVRGNFCSRCGRQLPYILGASFPCGVRFPNMEKKGNAFLAALNHARNAPKYRAIPFRGTTYHVALYDLTAIRHLAELDALLNRAFRTEVVEHTVDGKNFYPGRVPWSCFAARMENRPATGMIVPHEGERCFSYWGCHYAQDRQHLHYHCEGKEVFVHGIHGFFHCSSEDEDRFGGIWPPGLFERLQRTKFQFKKIEIRKEVMRHIKRYGGNRCPIFSAKHLDEQLERIPDVLVPAENPQWGVQVTPHNNAGVYLACYRPKMIAARADTCKEETVTKIRGVLE